MTAADATPRRRPGRPAADEARPARARIEARVPEDVAVELRAAAQADGRTPSSCVCEAVEGWLARRSG